MFATTDDILTMTVLWVTGFSGVYLFVVYGWNMVHAWLTRLERRFDLVLNQQLLMNIPAKAAMGFTLGGGLLFGLAAWAFFESGFALLLGIIPMVALPQMLFAKFEERRRKRLNEQIVDGITGLASGVRAGLTLVQSMQLMVKNQSGPIKQEFQQLLLEYELGIDLHLAMQNTTERIGSSYYRLLFSAIQAHRQRGGDMGQSLDRIGDSIREIQRLEGRLDALTAQGRWESYFMAGMPFVIIFILYFMFPTEIGQLFTEPLGRVILLVALAMIGTGFVWIRRIMQVDI
jgi:tight adherence protein B